MKPLPLQELSGKEPISPQCKKDGSSCFPGSLGCLWLLSELGARVRAKMFLSQKETNVSGEGGGTGKEEVSGFQFMTVTGRYREVKPSETLLVDVVGHGLLMPAVLQLLDVFCKRHNKKGY